MAQAPRDLALDPEDAPPYNQLKPFQVRQSAKTHPKWRRTPEGLCRPFSAIFVWGPSGKRPRIESLPHHRHEKKTPEDEKDVVVHPR